MEIKKSPKADLENKKMLFLEIGLVAALAITGVAFAWSSEPEPPGYESTVKHVQEQEYESMERTEQDKPEPPKEEQKKAQAKVLTDNLTIVDNKEEIEVPDLIFSEDASVFDDFSFDMEGVEEEIEEDEEIFTVLEDPATFQGGGIGEFRTWVMTKLKYPQIAQENGIQGNVIIEFVIDENGKLGRIKVLQAPDPVLSDEAIRVLEESNKLKRGWKPGKQRGKAVKMKFVLPVSFKLQN
ncbi:MAG: energy transducer TonB [Alistipes sp.]|nr:energy transducer TonB [Alistipes sp.]